MLNYNMASANKKHVYLILLLSIAIIFPNIIHAQIKRVNIIQNTNNTQYKKSKPAKKNSFNGNQEEDHELRNHPQIVSVTSKGSPFTPAYYVQLTPQTKPKGQLYLESENKRLEKENKNLQQRLKRMTEEINKLNKLAQKSLVQYIP